MKDVTSLIMLHKYALTPAIRERSNCYRAFTSVIIVTDISPVLDNYRLEKSVFSSYLLLI